MGHTEIQQVSLHVDTLKYAETTLLSIEKGRFFIWKLCFLQHLFLTMLKESVVFLRYECLLCVHSAEL